MQTLPVSQVLPEIKSALLTHNRLVLQAPPGAGKTTIVPLALLDEPWLQGRQVVMLEPRRLAARSCAARMAFLLGEKVGETVGYQIRNERCFSKKTKILVVTEGILTRKLQGDPALENTALVIFDEFHERNLQGDLSLAFALQSQELLRDDLRVMVMSATLNTEAICKLLGDAPLVSSEGRSFPVEDIFLPPKTPQPTRKELIGVMSSLIADILRRDEGSILVFLPGIKEIRQLERSLLDHLVAQKIDDVIVVPLYGDQGKAQQDSAIMPVPKGKRKIVLATNIAETSLTIEGIGAVVDSGLQRESLFDADSGMNRLQTSFISQDSAAQRSGRAGRLQAGKCYRIWHERRHHELKKHQSPEILTSDLAPMMLELSAWGIDEVNELGWLDLPAPAAVEHARVLLHALGATDGLGKITPHGRAMLALGVHPRLAHMILKARSLGFAYDACLLAALLSEKDIVSRSSGRSSNIGSRLDILHAVQSGSEFRDVSVDRGQCRRVQQTAEEFHRKLKYAAADSGVSVQKRDLSPDMVGVLLAFAYPDRIAQCRGPKERRYLLSGGKGAVLDQDDEHFGETYLVIADLDAQKTQARIFMAAGISVSQIEEFFPELIAREHSVRWNPEAQRVEARQITRLGSITLKEAPSEGASQEEVALALVEGIANAGLECLSWSKEAMALRERAGFVNYQKRNNSEFAFLPELPDFSDAYLLETLEEWLLPHLSGFGSIKACQRLDMFGILSGMLRWEQKQELDVLAPLKVAVPSGSKIAVDYSDPESPVLAVRLQELFGLEETPAVLRERFNLLLHLLSPAYRPMQVTRDLKSFWLGAYHDVKKELRGKYKKHYWPDDPLTAQATGKTKRFMDN